MWSSLYYQTNKYTLEKIPWSTKIITNLMETLNMLELLK